MYSRYLSIIFFCNNYSLSLNATHRVGSEHVSTRIFSHEWNKRNHNLPYFVFSRYLLTCRTQYNKTNCTLLISFVVSKILTLLHKIKYHKIWLRNTAGMEVLRDTEIADACRYKYVYNISVFYDFYEARDATNLYSSSTPKD